MDSSPQISVRQRDILAFITTFHLEHGYPPALREIRDGLGLSSTSVVRFHLRALERKGLIDLSSRISRGIVIKTNERRSPNRGHGGRVPLLGVIAAGLPLPQPDAVDMTSAEMIDVPPDLLCGDARDLYALRVRGRSMIDALIDDGDIVLIRYQETADNGQMVAACIAGENTVTIKRFFREGDKVRLQPANITITPISVDAARVHIHGRVVGVLRSM